MTSAAYLCYSSCPRPSRREALRIYAETGLSTWEPHPGLAMVSEGSPHGHNQVMMNRNGLDKMGFIRQMWGCLLWPSGALFLHWLFWAAADAGG